MNKKIYLIPLTLLGALIMLTWGCGEEKDEEDLCQAFDEGLPEECEIPTICCPLDGTNCYYVNPDGDDYYCDASLDSSENPDGCNDAVNNYISDHCTKMTKSTEDGLRASLTKFTKELMAKARLHSVCE